MHLKKTHIALVVLSVFVVSAVAVWAISFGSFVSKSTNAHFTGFNAYSFGDIDNNGTLDAVGEGTGTYLSTLRGINTGSPVYLSHTHLAAIQFNFYGNALGDLDNDGDLDLITVGPNGNNTSPNNVYYFDNGTNKRYELVGSTYTLSGNSVFFYGQAAAIADFTNDNKKDALWIGTGEVVLGTNSTTVADTITFSSITNLGLSISGSVGGNYGIGIGDFNNDGNKDFVVPNNSFVTSHYGGFYQLGLGNGSGTFTFSTPIANDQSDNRPLAVAVGDVNKDGKDDFVINRANFATAGGQMILFTRNAGNTGFDQTTIVSSTNQYRGVAIADLDNDTWPDIVQQRGFGGPFDIYLNNGSGGFPATASATVSASSINNYTLADMSADGLKDIVTAAPNSIGYYPQSVDSTPPTITNVSSDKANGTYTVGEVIDIDVTFSEAVTSTGNVTVTLETGTTDRTCTFTVSNATTGTCNYTVQAGDVSDDLTVNTIAGTIKDAVLNSMTNFTPTTNLAANKALVINPPVSGGSSSTSSPNPDNLKVVLSVPNGGETWKGGSTQWIFWGSSGAAPRNVTLQLSTDGGSAYADIASGLNDSGSYQWTVPTMPTTKARVRVQFLSSGTVYSSDVSDSDFTIVDPTPPPTLTLVQQPSDKPGFILKPRDTFDATWTTEGTGAAKVRISLSVNAGKSFRPVATIDAAEKHYVWKVPIFASKKAVLKFEMLDANGKVLSTSQTPVFSFKTRTREQRIVIPGLGL